jgi:hypothetical protein
VTTIHMCLSIRGVLSWPWRDFKRQFKGVFTGDDGRVLTPEQARDYLLDELSKGHKVLPTGPCEGFNYETGCPGHKDCVQTEKRVGQ